MDEEWKGEGSLCLPTNPSSMGATGFIQMMQGERKDYIYEIKVDDCELLAQIMKSESVISINKDKCMAILFDQENLFQCQISLKNLIRYAGSSSELNLKMEV